MHDTSAARKGALTIAISSGLTEPGAYTGRTKLVLDGSVCMAEAPAAPMAGGSESATDESAHVRADHCPDPPSSTTRVLVTVVKDEVLKARLPAAARVHRLAAKTLLEAIALFYQQRIRVVLSADSEATSFLRQGSLGKGNGHVET
jgi:hypothetical protein